MKTYRVTFVSKTNAKDLKYDLKAHDSDEAFKLAYKKCEVKHRTEPRYLYSDVQIEEVPEDISNIGIKFRYQDLMLKKNMYQYMVIRANSEKEAKDYYNKNLYGKQFIQIQPHKVVEKGNCIYDSIIETYFAACPGYDFDATCI